MGRQMADFYKWWRESHDMANLAMGAAEEAWAAATKAERERCHAIAMAFAEAADEVEVKATDKVRGILASAQAAVCRHVALDINQNEVNLPIG